MSGTMKFNLKHDAAKKLNRHVFLAMFFAFIIWVLMAFLFLGDGNSHAIVLYLGGSMVIIPYLFKKHIRPYLQNLAANAENAYFEIDNEKVTFRHFDNVEQFDNQQIDFHIKDIAKLKKSFRKGGSINKITLTVNNKNSNSVNIVVKDFENMQQLVDILMEKMTQVSKQ